MLAAEEYQTPSASAMFAVRGAQDGGVVVSASMPVLPAPTLSSGKGKGTSGKPKTKTKTKGKSDSKSKKHGKKTKGKSQKKGKKGRKGAKSSRVSFGLYFLKKVDAERSTLL